MSELVDCHAMVAPRCPDRHPNADIKEFLARDSWTLDELAYLLHHGHERADR